MLSLGFYSNWDFLLVDNAFAEILNFRLGLRDWRSTGKGGPDMEMPISRLHQLHLDRLGGGSLPSGKAPNGDAQFRGNHCYAS